MSISKRTTQWIVTAALLVALLIGGFAGAALHRPAMQAVGADVTGAPTTVAPDLFDPPPDPTIEPAHGSGLIAPAAVQPSGEIPETEVLSSRIEAIDRSAAVSEDDEATFAVSVIDAETGEPLAAMNESELLIPASNTKTLTILALLNALEHDQRFATRVLQPEAGQVVLVGGGDPLLRSAAAATGEYPEAPSLEELADLTVEALHDSGEQTVAVNYDESLFADSGWNETWPQGYRSQVTQIGALWVDTGRTDGGRSTDPALAATLQFAELLAARGVSVIGEPAAVSDTAGTELARVESLPVHVLAEQAMLFSDNSWTEVLGFQLALATDRPATFAGAVDAIEEQLRELGIWTEGAELHDASGLSRSNLVSARMLAQVNQHIVADPRLQVILDGMPVAGVTGTLRQRFNDEISAPARGIAKAKTGSLTGVATLAGTTVTEDGRVVTFAALVNGSTQPWETRVWIDRVVGTITGCGC